jgi:hypothetical protein
VDAAAVVGRSVVGDRDIGDGHRAADIIPQTAAFASGVVVEQTAVDGHRAVGAVQNAAAV